CQQISNWPLTF
nr:immunoglobulin light chain junction region [Macaca mulatta]